MQKNLYAFLTTLVCLAAGLTARAQSVSDYSFSARDTAYTFITPDSNLTVDPLPNDDFFYSDIPIGFAFPWHGSAPTSLSVTSNGVLTFDPNSFLGGIFNAGSGDVWNTDNFELISFFNADLTASDAVNSQINIKRGTQNGERYFVLDVRRIRRYDSGGGFAQGFDGDSINVQTWLWESGRVNIIYGPSAANATTRTIMVGVRGADNTDQITLSGTWASPVEGTDNDNAITIGGTNIWRNAGRMFTFIPPTPVPADISVRSLLLPGVNNALCGGSATQTIQATLINLGTDPLASANVCYQVGTAAPVCTTLTFSPALPRFARYVVSFSGAQSANLAATGDYSIRLYANVANDANHGNDTTSLAIHLGGDVILPTGRTWSSYDELANTGNGFRLAQGRNASQPYTGFSLEDYTVNGYGSVLENFISAFNDTTHVWAIRDGIINSTADQKAIGFSLAVGNGDFNGGILALNDSIYDDVFRVNYSTDCGQTWNVLRTFTQASIDSGIIGSDMHSFILPIPGLAVGQTFSIAFEWDNMGTLNPNFNSYAWYLDNVRFPNPIDVAVDSIFIDNSLFTSCARGNQERVGVRVVNNGSTPLSNISVGYRLDNGTWLTQTLAGPVAPGATTITYFTGAQGANLSTIATYNFDAYATVAGDPAHDNDSTSRTLALGTSLDTIPLTTRFEDIFALRAEGFNSYSGQGSNFHQVAQNTFIDGFPPIWDETTTVTVSATGTPANTVDWFLRPNYELNGAELGFAFSLLVSSENFGADPIDDIDDDTLQVVASNDCGNTWSVLRSFSQADLDNGNLDNTMRTFKVNIPFRSGSLIIGWRYNANGTAAPNDYRWQMDSVRFGVGSDVQAVAVTGVPSFLGYCFGTPVPVTIKYQNTGFNIIDSVTVSYTAPGSTATPVTIVRPLAVGAVDSVTLNIPLVITQRGPIRITGTVTTPGDGLSANNTIDFVTGYGTARGLPAVPYGNFNSLISNGYTTGTGPNGLSSGGWTASTAFGNPNPTVQAALLNTATSRQDLWLTSTAYIGQVSGINVRFRIACNANATGTALNPQVGSDDSLKLVYRTNCGPWQLAAAYTAADIANRNVTGQLTQKVVLLPNVTTADTFQVAFLAHDNGTTPTASYHWSLNSVFVTDVAATQPSLQTLGLLLAPNPASSRVQIQGLTTTAKADLLDIQGRTLRSATLTPSESTIQLDGLPHGTYMIRVSTDQGRATQRLVVE